MACDVPRPFLTVHLFGSGRSGKTTLKKQWFDSSHSKVLSEIADVHIRLQQECSREVLVAIRSSVCSGYKHHSFVIMYRPDSQESIQVAESCVRLIHSTYSTEPMPPVYVVENHFEDTFKPHTEQPAEFPISPDQPNGLLVQPRLPPKLWRVRVTDSVLMGVVLDSLIVNPVLSMLDDRERSKLIETACQDGHLAVVKLLISTMRESNLVSWLARSLFSMDPIVSQPTPKLNALAEIARFAYNLDATMAMSTIVRLAEKYPNASLYMLDQFCHQSHSEQHFVMAGVALGALPRRWVENKRLTHVNLSNNLLLSLPVELFQEPTLCSVKISHNCLEKLPSILKWNCPKLREIDISHNRLIDEPFSIFEGKKDRSFTVDKNPPKKADQQNMITAAQRTLRLTGYNLYPCICSLTRVNISNNPTLSQIPEWVCVLPNLSLLEMKALPRVTTLTPFLAHCRSLCVLHLDTEQLVSPPHQEAQRGTHVIMAYLRCRLRGSTPYRHVRLVLLGAPESGKTTLFNQFMKTGGKGERSSPGVKETTFDYPPKSKSRKDQPKVTFHLVDFAGDEMYRSVHQCFLTTRTVYLCLWNVTNGKTSLRQVLPWLRSIQACVPGSPVVLVATHIDRRPGISGATIVQWEEELFGEISKLSKTSHTAQRGLPPIMQSVVMDCKNRDDVDLLIRDVYSIALCMKLGSSRVPMLEELLPRSYQELQTLIEVKVRSLCREGGAAPVLRHEEFVAYVRSLTLHNPHDIEQDDEEFAVACHFLHQAGVIVHYRSIIPGVSDLYCLDPQWLFDTLASVVRNVAQRDPEQVNSTISNEDLPAIFREAKVPSQIYSSFLAMMESFDIIVSLDFEKKLYLFPALLPPDPAPHYPEYDLGTNDPNQICQYVQLDYVPPAFFPQLLSRVLLYIRQLSGQLLAIGSGQLSANLEGADSFSLSPSHSTMSSLRLSHAYHLDHHSYLVQDDSVSNESTLRSQLWALSAANVAGTPRPGSRYKSLTEKLVSISQPLLEGHPRSASRISDSDTESNLSHCDQFSNYTFWQNGLYTEFPCGTRFWLELCESALSIVIQGELIPRVKTLSFLSSCIGALVEESYAGLHFESYSPCPSCLSSFWHSFQSSRRFASSSLEVSQTLAMNEFMERVEYSRRRPSVTTGQPHSFGGTNFSLNSPPQSPAATPHDDLPMIAVLEDQLALFPLETAVHQSITSSTILCPRCQNRVALQTLSPHVLLVDFKDSYLLNPRKLVLEETDMYKLGEGGFGKVFQGTYQDEPVAIKVFRKRYNNQVLLHRYKDLREEVTIMSNLDHPRVVSLTGVCLKPLCIVLKLAPEGSLKDHLALCPQGLESSVAHRLLFQVADGIRYLHSVYVVHRDIKPGNILIWSLSPERVDAKLADYGVSQFYTPGGLRRHKGTEEYMAPELFRSHNNQAYDEKVDVFSFALVLHYVVTGRKLFAGLANKREQLHRISNLHIPQLSASLAEAMAENSPLPSSSKFKHLLQDGRHPASRTDVINSCHSVCMQQLMVDCLSTSPQDRPSAQGVCSRLLICPGGMPQANFYIGSPVLHAGYSSHSNIVVAMQKGCSEVAILPTDTWELKLVTTPYSEEPISCMTVVGNEVFFASSASNLVFSLHLPLLQSGHISPQPLHGQALCMFPQKSPSGEGFRIVVGMSSGRVAVFANSPQISGRVGHILESQPHVTQVVTNPDPLKTAINCGTYHKSCVWCGCGRYLIGLDHKEYLMKVYKPVTPSRDVNANVSLIIGCHDYLWLGFKDRSQIVLCDAFKAQFQETLDIHAILGRSGTPVSKTMVTDIVRGHNAIWVSTNGGHLLSFNAITADVILVHCREQHITHTLCLYDNQLVTFAKGTIGVEAEEEQGDLCGLFTVWTDYIDIDHV